MSVSSYGMASEVQEPWEIILIWSRMQELCEMLKIWSGLWEIISVGSGFQELQYAMRRAGQNPTDIEVQDLINKIDNGSGTMDFEVINTISSWSTMFWLINITLRR